MNNPPKEIRIAVETGLWENHGAHKVTLLRCVEPRLRKAMDEQFMEQALDHAIFDGPYTFAGGAKALAEDCEERRAVVKQLRLIQGMGVERTYIVVHPACGGYGIGNREQEYKQQAADLQEGVRFLAEALPAGMEIFAYIGIEEASDGENTPFVFKLAASALSSRGAELASIAAG